MNQTEKLMNDVVIEMYMLEKEFFQRFFDIMIHLTVYLVEELFICGPVQCHWMYSMEWYMKTFKGNVHTKAKSKGSMAERALQ